MALQDDITQIWVKLTGRRIDPTIDSWLIGPTGHKDVIKDKFIYSLAKENDLQLERNKANFGLLEHIEDIGITKYEKAKLHPLVTDFYENTSNYNFEIWSEWTGFFKPFGKLLSVIFSKRLQQLNLPLSAMDSAKGWIVRSSS